MILQGDSGLAEVHHQVVVVRPSCISEDSFGSIAIHAAPGYMPANVRSLPKTGHSLRRSDGKWLAIQCQFTLRGRSGLGISMTRCWSSCVRN